MDKSNGVQIVKNGTSAKHNNNLDKKQSIQEPYETKDLGTKKVKACMLKTFNRMKKRIGFLIYQFVLPALQVILIFMSILKIFSKCNQSFDFRYLCFALLSVKTPKNYQWP